VNVGKSNREFQREGEHVPRPQSIDDIIGSAVSKAMLSIVPAIQKQVAAMAAAELEKGLAVRNGGQPRRRVPVRRSRPRGEEMTRWVADKRARRVPNFVIEMTDGLDTKKKIVARYGENGPSRKAGAKAAGERAGRVWQGRVSGKRIRTPRGK
jgi:hypothetical protein